MHRQRLGIYGYKCTRRDIPAQQFCISVYAILTSFHALVGFDMLDDDKLSAVWCATIRPKLNRNFALLPNLHRSHWLVLWIFVMGIIIIVCG